MSRVTPRLRLLRHGEVDRGAFFGPGARQGALADDGGDVEGQVGEPSLAVAPPQ